MSWSTSFEIPKGTEPNEVFSMVNNAEVNGNDDCPEERESALDSAAQAVDVVLSSGVLGSLHENDFAVMLSGHCNPENKPRDGWANDCLNISIVQKTVVVIGK